MRGISRYAPYIRCSKREWIRKTKIAWAVVSNASYSRFWNWNIGFSDAIYCQESIFMFYKHVLIGKHPSHPTFASVYLRLRETGSCAISNSHVGCSRNVRMLAMAEASLGENCNSSFPKKTSDSIRNESCMAYFTRGTHASLPRAKDAKFTQIWLSPQVRLCTAGVRDKE